jgi:hypothetical protein
MHLLTWNKFAKCLSGKKSQLQTYLFSNLLLILFLLNMFMYLGNASFEKHSRINIPLYDHQKLKRVFRNND